MIKTIFFDVGGTLLTVEWPRVFEGLQQAPRTPAEMRAASRAGILEYSRRTRAGTARIYEYLACCVEAAGAAASDAQYEQLWQQHLARNLWRAPAPMVEETLRELARRGFRLAVISNSEGKVKELLEETQLAHHFELVVDSGIEGVSKPDKEIFLRACARMRVTPRESLYVGDIYELDVKGAHGAGMQAALIDPYQLFDEEAARDFWLLRALSDLPERLPAQI